MQSNAVSSTGGSFSIAVPPSPGRRRLLRTRASDSASSGAQSSGTAAARGYFHRLNAVLARTSDKPYVRRGLNLLHVAARTLLCVGIGTVLRELVAYRHERDTAERDPFTRSLAGCAVVAVPLIANAITLLRSNCNGTARRGTNVCRVLMAVENLMLTAVAFRQGSLEANVSALLGNTLVYCGCRDLMQLVVQMEVTFGPAARRTGPRPMPADELAITSAIYLTNQLCVTGAMGRFAPSGQSAAALEDAPWLNFLMRGLINTTGEAADALAYSAMLLPLAAALGPWLRKRRDAERQMPAEFASAADNVHMRVQIVLPAGMDAFDDLMNRYSARSALFATVVLSTVVIEAALQPDLSPALAGRLASVAGATVLASHYPIFDWSLRRREVPGTVSEMGNAGINSRVEGLDGDDAGPHEAGEAIALSQTHSPA